MAIMTEQQARDLLNRVLSFSRADECQCQLTGSNEGNIRYARNSVSTSGEVSNVTLAVSSSFGKQTGAATINQFLADGGVVADVDATNSDKTIERRSNDRFRELCLRRAQARNVDVVIGARRVVVGARDQLLLKQLLGALQRRFAAFGVGPCLVDLRLENGGLDRIERGAPGERLTFLEVYGENLPGHFSAQRR